MSIGGLINRSQSIEDMFMNQLFSSFVQLRRDRCYTRIDFSFFYTIRKIIFVIYSENIQFAFLDKICPSVYNFDNIHLFFSYISAGRVFFFLKLRVYSVEKNSHKSAIMKW